MAVFSNEKCLSWIVYIFENWANIKHCFNNHLLMVQTVKCKLA